MKTKTIVRESLNKGAAVLLLATVLVKLAGALFKIPLSSNAVLGDLGFGYFSSAYDLFSPIYTLAMSGFPIAIARIVADFVARSRWRDIKTLLKVSKRLFVFVGAIAGIFTLIFVFPFVRLTDKSGQSIYSMLTLAPSFILCFTVSVYRGYFEGFHNMTITAVSNVIEALGKLVLGLGLAVITVKYTSNVAYGAAAAMFGITLGTIASLIYLYAYFKRSRAKLDFKIQTLEAEPYNIRKLLKLMIYVSIPIVISSMSSSIVSLIDAITVRWQLSHMNLTDIYSIAVTEYLSDKSVNEIVEIIPTFLYGIRSKAFTIYNLVPTLTVAIGVSAVPILTESYTKKKFDVVVNDIQSVLKLSSLITLPAAAGLISIGTCIMTFIYGEGWSSEIGGKMLCIYGIAVVFSGLAVPIGCVLQAINRQKETLLNVVIGLFFKLILNLLLCANEQLNVFGAVIATVFCNLVIFVLHCRTLYQFTGRSLDIRHNFGKPLTASIICGITAYFISLSVKSPFVTVISIAISALVYVFFLIQFDTFSKQEILKLPIGNILLKVYQVIKIKSHR